MMRTRTINISIVGVVLLVVAYHVASCRRSDSSAEGMARTFLKQQQGIDRAETILIEWKHGLRNVSYHTYERSPSMIRASRKSENEYKVCTYDVKKDKGVIVQTGSKSDGAVIAPYRTFDRLSYLTDSLWVFFPVLKHSWHTGETPVRTSSVKNSPQFSLPPLSFFKPRENCVAIGCRNQPSGWFDILEFDVNSRRLVMVTSYVNRKEVPDDVYLKRDNNPDASDREIWDLQSQHSRLFRKTEYSSHKELPLDIVMPTVVISRSFNEAGEFEFNNSYTVTKVEINNENALAPAPATIPDGLKVLDFTVDPYPGKGVVYTSDSTRSIREWEKVLSGATNSAINRKPQPPLE